LVSEKPVRVAADIAAADIAAADIANELNF
jgi:hypothetical protein